MRLHKEQKAGNGTESTFRDEDRHNKSEAATMMERAKAENGRSRETCGVEHKKGRRRWTSDDDDDEQ